MFTTDVNDRNAAFSYKQYLTVVIKQCSYASVIVCFVPGRAQRPRWVSGKCLQGWWVQAKTLARLVRVKSLKKLAWRLTLVASWRCVKLT